jgi:GNAT superfamily N-acetyltransferase
VVKVFVNEHEWPSVYIVARKLSELGYYKAGFYSILEESFSSAEGVLARINEYLRGPKGVGLGELGVEFDFRGRGLSITSLLDRLNERAGHRGETFLIVSAR